MKRILTVQDISCVGKCSLTVALPVLSAMGLETAVLPTAILSTHTGGFSGYTFRDLTGDLGPIMAHWKKEGIDFSAIYTGYLGSLEQIAWMERLFAEFGQEALKVVDPVMADGGKLYAGFSPEFAGRMAQLCGAADVILPNLSEAAFLLGLPYEPNPGPERVKELCEGLCALGCRQAVLTGISRTPGKLGAAGLDSDTGEFFVVEREHLPVSFHGTGDLFASAVTGALARDKNLYDAVTIAVDFTVDAIAKTMADPQARTYGVNFEEALGPLMARL